MIKETARIVSVENDGLWVETYKQSACGKCAAKKGCGQSLLAGSVMSDMSLIKANFDGVTSRIWGIGDNVDIGIEEHAMVIGTMITYLLPLLLMLMFAGIGAYLGQSDFYSVLGAVLGLVLGACFSRWHSAVNANNHFYHAVVIE